MAIPLLYGFHIAPMMYRASCECVWMPCPVEPHVLSSSCKSHPLGLELHIVAHGCGTHTKNGALKTRSGYRNSVPCHASEEFRTQREGGTAQRRLEDLSSLGQS